MDENDFYEDDEPIEDIDVAWKRGEPGVTSGSRDLNQRARSVIDRAIACWDGPEGFAGVEFAADITSIQITGVQLVHSGVDVAQSGTVTVS
jgi:hypothetical protein